MDDSDGQSSLLVVILDTNPVWWGQRSMETDGVNEISYIIAQDLHGSIQLFTCCSIDYVHMSKVPVDLHVIAHR